MFSNHRPAVRGRDEGVWRRLRLVPWPTTIPEAQRDPYLADKLAGEAEGILAWLVEGARRFLADQRLTPPDAVRAATAAYRRDSDLAGRFVTDVLRLGSGTTRSVDISAELERWVTEQGLERVSMNEVADILKAAGCTNSRQVVAGKKATIWTGVTIDSSPPNTSPDQHKREERTPPPTPCRFPVRNPPLARVNGSGCLGVSTPPPEPEPEHDPELQRALEEHEAERRYSDEVILDTPTDDEYRAWFATQNAEP
jgi:hypothetical protein